MDQQIARVNSLYGVNARRAPTADAELVRIMEDGESAFVFGQQGSGADGWLQVFLTENDILAGAPIAGELAWVSAEFVELSTEPMLPDLVAEVKSYLGITDGEEAEAVAEPAPAAADATSAESAEVTVVINSPTGLNARSGPSTDAEIVVLLDDGAAFDVVSRSEDSQWVQIVLDDGTEVWVSVEFVTVNGDLTTVPAPTDSTTPSADAGETITSTAQVTTTGEITASDTPTSTSEITATSEATEASADATPTDTTTDTATVTIEAVGGVNARAEPSLDANVIQIVEQGSVLAATGLSEDGEWVQILLDDGGQAWVFKAAVTTTPDVDDLPVVDPNAPAAETTPVDASTEVTSTTTATPTAEAEIVGPFVTISQLLTQVHTEPNLDSLGMAIVRSSQVLPATGINADQTWIQIALPDNRIGWIAASTAKLSVDPNVLRVTE
ncbi:MAG: SH3 domain-containing protein [Caldilineaceae bacterium]|nr:SH3 domain-containing protein [Caldilineaceae bacterium]